MSDLKKILLIDRVPDEKSLSSSLMVYSFIICVIACGLEMADVIKTTSSTFELFMATAGLHFGKRWVSSKGQSIESEKKQ